MPDIYGSDHGESVRHGVRVVKMDPVPIMAAMGAVTERLGLGGHLFDNLLRTVPRGADIRDAGPHDRRAGRVERRDIIKRLRSPQYGCQCRA